MRPTRSPIATLLLLLALGVCAPASPAWSAPSRSIHDAVVDTWFPVDSLGLDAATLPMAKAVRESLWVHVARSIEWGSLLAALEEPARLARIRTALAAGGGRPVRGFAEFDLGERERAMTALLGSDVNEDRQLAMRLRLACLSAIYASPLGRRFAGLDPRDAQAAARESEAPSPQFPPTWLVHDAAARRLGPRTGRLDAIVVGSGPAGAVIASELQHAGWRVLVLEGGPFVVPGSMNTRAMPRLLESRGRRASVDGSVLFSNAEAVGGGSTVNIDLAFSPTHPSVQHRIEDWRAQGHVALDQYRLPDLERAEAWVRARIGTRRPVFEEVNRNNRVLWDGAQRSGWHPKLYELNTFPPGAWPTPASDKRSAVSGMLLAAMQDSLNPLAVLPDAWVTAIHTEPRKGGQAATGVRFVVRAPWRSSGVLADPLSLNLTPGDTLTVEADRVILCAGALGSASLLLRSGLGGAGVGRGIVVHPAVPVIGRFDETVDALEGTPATVFVDDLAVTRGVMFEAMSAGPEYAAMMMPGTGRQVFAQVRAYRHLAGFGAMLIDTPDPENRIRLDAEGRPQIDYHLTPTDRARLGEAVELAVRAMFRAGAREVSIPSYEPVLGAPSSGGLVFRDSSNVAGFGRRLRFLPNGTLVTSAHLQACDEMGSTAATSVVDHRHQVWGVGGLYVCDSSTFPSSVGANPMQSVYVFAKLFAEELLGASRSPARSEVSPP